MLERTALRAPWKAVKQSGWSADVVARRYRIWDDDSDLDDDLPLCNYAPPPHAARRERMRSPAARAVRAQAARRGELQKRRGDHLRKPPLDDGRRGGEHAQLVPAVGIGGRGAAADHPQPAAGRGGEAATADGDERGEGGGAAPAQSV